MIDDETLVAYVDGELEPAEHDEIATAAESDPALARRIQVFAESGAWVQHALDRIVDEPVPAGLTELIMRPAPTPRTPVFRSWALAASLAAMVLGGLVGFVAGNQPPTGPFNESWISEAVNEALEHSRSGSAITLADGGRSEEIMVLMSFRDDRGRLCREYSVRQPHRAFNGVACRATDSPWEVVFMTPRTTSTNASGSTGYMPASGQSESNEGLLDSMVERVLSPVEERRFLDNGWRE